jgi:hypothetical protein
VTGVVNHPIDFDKLFGKPEGTDVLLDIFLGCLQIPGITGLELNAETFAKIAKGPDLFPIGFILQGMSQ